MKPIIVTWANESWILNDKEWIHGTKLGIWLFYCERHAPQEKITLIENNIKLIARPKK